MKKISKYFLMFFLSTIIGLFILYIIFISYISSASLRNNLSKRLSLATGYNVSLQQSPQIKFFPTLSASFNYIALRDKTNDFLKADKINLDFSPLKALKGKIAISDIKIINPQFFLFNPVKDFSNFMQHSFFPIHNVEKIIIENGTVYYNPDKNIKVNALNGNIFLGNKKEKPSINLNGYIENNKITISSQTIYDAAKNILQLNNLAIALNKQELTGALQIINHASPKIVGSIALNNIELANYIKFLLTNATINTKNNLDLDIRLSAATAQWKDFIISNLATTIQSDEKGLNLNVGNAQTKLGNVNLVYKLTPSGKNFISDLQLNANSADYKLLKLPVIITGKNKFNFSSKQTLSNAELIKFINLLAKNLWHGPAKINVTFAKGQIETYNIPKLLELTETYKIRKKINKHKIITIQAPYEKVIDKSEHNMSDFTNLKITIDNVTNDRTKFSAEGIINNNSHNLTGEFNSQTFKLKGISKDINYWIFKDNNLHFIGLKNLEQNKILSNKLLETTLNNYKND